MKSPGKWLLFLLAAVLLISPVVAFYAWLGSEERTLEEFVAREVHGVLSPTLPRVQILSVRSVWKEVGARGFRVRFRHDADSAVRQQYWYYVQESSGDWTRSGISTYPINR